MGFKCDFCSKHSSSKPLKVVLETHETKQYGYDEEGNFVTHLSRGPVAEFNQCPPCSGVEVTPQIKPDYSGYKAITMAGIAHARSCKKMVVECDKCKKNLADFAKFPLPILSICLESPQVRPAAPSMAEVLVGNLIARAEEKSKRAVADFAAAYPILKQYEQRGGGL